MPESPRLRPLGHGQSCEHLSEAGLAMLRESLERSDGYDIEPNFADWAEDIGVQRILRLDEQSSDESGVIFAVGPYGIRYRMRRDSGAIFVCWEGADDRGAAGPTELAPNLASLLANLELLERDPSFDGCATASDLAAALGGEFADGLVALRPAFSGATGPPLTDADATTRAYVEQLPGWLQAVLSIRNGGHMRAVPVQTQSGREWLDALYCVAARPDHGITEASSIRQVLLSAGVDPKYFPIGRTPLSDLVLVDRDGHVTLKRPDRIEPLVDNGAELIAAICAAAREPERKA